MKISIDIPIPDLCCQLAEECCELAQAALKYNRSISDTNPTPVTADRAKANIKEEMGDVLCCFSVLMGHIDNGAWGDEVSKMAEDKLMRWAERIGRSVKDEIHGLADT